MSEQNAPVEGLYHRLDGLLRRRADDTASTWEEEGRRHALAVFRAAARRVPAYREFLRRHGVDPERVRTYEEFRRVPVTDKVNYVGAHPLEDLVWDGDLSQASLVHASSGTTGVAHFWPCSDAELDQAAGVQELVYRDGFAADGASTLVVVCFGMGCWIAGSYTAAAARLVRQKGYDLTVVTPGFDKAEALRVLAALGPKFGQTVVAGIPSFVKDLLEAWARDARARQVRVKLLLAGEGFTEGWRDHVLRLTRAESPVADVAGILGSADGGILGFETPDSVRIRRLAAGREKVRAALFGGERLPALLNYVPAHRFFEEEGGELVVTACRAAPLVRYNTHDRGGLFTAADLAERLGPSGTPGMAGRLGLPFAYVFGRGALTATLYGANVYAENVQEVLLDGALARQVTGRFTLETKYDDNQDQYLQVNVELAEQARADEGLARRVADAFATTVRRLSSEYNRIYEEYGSRAAPRVVLCPHGDPGLFPRGVPKKSS
jgi:phenylacetate-CoA ligase